MLSYCYKKKNIINFILCFFRLLIEKIPKIFFEIYQLSLFIHLAKLTNNGTLSKIFSEILRIEWFFFQLVTTVHR